MTQMYTTQVLTFVLLMQIGVPSQPTCANGKRSDTHLGFQVIAGWMLDDEYSVEYQCRGRQSATGSAIDGR